MRMCYLSISHTNVFSVTVPPRRLQEGSGALIKAAFAGQECGLLRPGVTERLGVRSAEPLLTWPVGWGPGLTGSCGWLALGIFPSLLSFLPDLRYHHFSPNTGNSTVPSQTHPHPSSFLHNTSPPPPTPWLLGFLHGGLSVVSSAQGQHSRNHTDLTIPPSVRPKALR